ncbi:ATP synthase subunit C lysine N-methyltransferase [Amblyomma americanum]
MGHAMRSTRAPESQNAPPGMSGASTEQRRRRLGKAAIALTGCGAVGIVAVAVPFLSPALRKVCLPYVPATDTQVRNVAAVLRKRSQRSALVDLGSGDGRIVFEAAKLGFTPSVGVELNPWFPLPTLKPDDAYGDGIDTVWLYRIALQQHSRPVEASMNYQQAGTQI